MTTVDGVIDTASKIDVIVLEENHIEETDTMVHTTTNLHCLLLQHTETWSSLTGVEDVSLGTFKALYIHSGHGSNTAHTLHDVEHETLSLKQRTGLALYDHSDVALLHVGTILQQNLYLHGRIEACEHLLSHFYTSQNAIFLDEQMALTHGVLWNATQGCVVAITDILSKCQVYQLVF